MKSKIIKIKIIIIKVGEKMEKKIEEEIEEDMEDEIEEEIEDEIEEEIEVDDEDESEDESGEEIEDESGDESEDESGDESEDKIESEEKFSGELLGYKRLLDVKKELIGDNDDVDGFKEDGDFDFLNLNVKRKE